MVLEENHGEAVMPLVSHSLSSGLFSLSVSVVRAGVLMLHCIVREERRAHAVLFDWDPSASAHTHWRFMKLLSLSRGNKRTLYVHNQNS